MRRHRLQRGHVGRGSGTGVELVAALVMVAVGVASVVYSLVSILSA